MWYISGIGWNEGSSGTAASYVIKRARSKDGLEWKTGSEPALELKDANEVALARPSVLKDDAGWHMWFCYRERDTPYKIGYAHSSDGEQWFRQDETSGLIPSSSGWDSEMVCYPFVFDVESTRYMLYCGNGYGQSGFGLAAWVG